MPPGTNYGEVNRRERGKGKIKVGMLSERQSYQQMKEEAQDRVKWRSTLLIPADRQIHKRRKFRKTVMMKSVLINEITSLFLSVYSFTPPIAVVCLGALLRCLIRCPIHTRQSGVLLKLHPSYLISRPFLYEISFYVKVVTFSLYLWMLGILNIYF